MNAAQSALANAPEIATESVACGLCGARDAELFAESYDYEYQTCRNRWSFVRCRACQNVYLNPRPTRAMLATIYPPTYYSYNYDAQVNPIARWAKDQLDARRFAAIQRSLGRPIGRYLDIGCGNGRALRAVAAAGTPRADIYGTEFDAGVVARLSAEGFQVQAKAFEEAEGLPEASFDLVTLFSVLEHVGNPRSVLEKVRGLLAPGGMVVCEVPNVASSNARLFRDKYWGGYHTPRHWNLFSPREARWLAAELGLAVERIAMTPGHAFWLWSLHHLVRFGWGLDGLGRWLNPIRCLPGVAVITPIDLLRGAWSGPTDNMLIYLRRS
jgi:SAM-dependent methyltransferase